MPSAPDQTTEAQTEDDDLNRPTAYHVPSTMHSDALPASCITSGNIRSAMQQARNEIPSASRSERKFVLKIAQGTNYACAEPV